MRYLTISDLFQKFSQSPHRREAWSLPTREGAGVILSRTYPPNIAFDASMPLINIAAAWMLWCRTPRNIYRLRPPAAAYMASVGLGFIPETPPASWGGDAICIESVDGRSPLVESHFSLAAYALPDTEGVQRYYFVALSTDGGGYSFSIPAALGRVNERMAAAGDLLDVAYLNHLGQFGVFPPHMQREFLAVLQFVFSFSIHLDQVETLPFLALQRQPGPLRVSAGRVTRGADPLWTYRDMILAYPPDKPAPCAGGTLDTTNLTLAPTIVRPHIRRIHGKATIINAFTAHRWRNPAKVGTKTRI